MSDKDEVLSRFKLFYGGPGSGITSWLGPDASEEVIDRLSQVKEEPLSKVQLDQLLVLSHEAGVSDGFFSYYWLCAPEHSYDVKLIPGFQKKWIDSESQMIISLDQLSWGLYRLYVDSLLYFGNIRSGYRSLRDKDEEDLKAFFQSNKLDTISTKKRGPALPLKTISKDDRYLISEMACKSYGDNPATESTVKEALLSAWKNHEKMGGGSVKISELLDGSYIKKKYANQHLQFVFSVDEILDDEVASAKDVEEKYSKVAKVFVRARNAALQNTRYYLSMVNDLDVYVATSMRTREDFRKLAAGCEKIFSDPRLKELQLRYFDPTLSAAEGHEDKGLIECLMVKSSKVLVYSAGEKESYGKDAEAAMALSLGKPVIFHCDKTLRRNFYRDVHPLSRLIHFDTGVAVGAMVTDSYSDVIELLYRIFENKMEYELEQPKLGYFRLKECLTGSVVRLQTNNDLLRETFWNYYHKG